MSVTAEDVTSMVLFARVVEERSFTKAAERLGMSKSAVSAQLARFEERLGAQLLHRSTRRLSLTEAGLALYPRCARLLAEADEASALARGLGQETTGLLRVNAPVSFGTRHLAPLVGAFLEEHPQVQVELSVEDRFVDPASGAFDVVVRIASRDRLGNSPSVTARRLGKVRLVVCASPGYLAAHGRPRSPEDLLGHHCLRYSHTTPHEEWRFMRDGEPAYIPVPSTFTSNSGDVLRAAAEADLGITILPHFLVADSLERGALEELTALRGWREELDLWALYVARGRAPAKVRAWVDFLAARLAKGL
jgi:DNA-binding transcriptional LysR family regulator